MKTIFGVVISWAIAAVIVWAIWWKAAPALCGLIPASAADWKGLLDFAIYAIVGLCGGIGLPLWVGIAGTGLVLASS